MEVTREQALELLQKYNKEPFHIQHALTVEGTMRYFARQKGFDEDEEFWGLVGLLHDVDYEKYPEEHTAHSREILNEIDAPEEMIHAVMSHAWGIHTDVKPHHLMEKILYATDELTGLIGAAALMRPSKSVMDMELKSVKKKFKDRKFAAGCNRDVIMRGAELLEYDLDELLSDTLDAMKSFEEPMRAELAALTGEKGE
ncbi:MAG: HDIG domain-containing protein [Peptoniphilaceae bacterium]|nr:HDIG domain-containing protein [Peptoniphilaceae bacterium]